MRNLLGLATVCLLGVGLVAPMAFAEVKKEEKKTVSKTSESKIVTTSSGLRYSDTVVGSGDEAVKGKQVSVMYSGWLLGANDVKGTKFDSSFDRGKPFTFSLGSGQVIAGWDEGVQGMKVGGKRTLYIPSRLGYGPRGIGNVIPANADLVFDVELLGVQ